MSPKLRVLVVDDSLINRQRISEAISRSGVGIVVATARDGSEALSRVQEHAPDAITLDLEMPRMDGYSFLRLLMGARPTPVIVVSSYSKNENVFRALELGALDFVAKTGDGLDAAAQELLVQKLSLVRSVRQMRRAVAPLIPSTTNPPAATQPLRRPRLMIAIGSSTGGPTALTEILSNMKPTGDYAVVIAQHMPAKFTRTFAQRLNRYSSLRVSEASDGDAVLAGTVLVCPGNHCMEVERDAQGELRVRILDPGPEERYVPNASRLLSSAAKTMGRRSVGVVLTGMGDDGAEGAQQIWAAGGRVIVESEQSAVVYGMPRATLKLVPASSVAPIGNMASELMRLVQPANFPQ